MPGKGERRTAFSPTSFGAVFVPYQMPARTEDEGAEPFRLLDTTRSHRLETYEQGLLYDIGGGLLVPEVSFGEPAHAGPPPVTEFFLRISTGRTSQGDQSDELGILVNG